MICSTYKNGCENRLWYSEVSFEYCYPHHNDVLIVEMKHSIKKPYSLESWLYEHADQYELPDECMKIIPRMSIWKPGDDPDNDIPFEDEESEYDFTEDYHARLKRRLDKYLEENYIGGIDEKD